MKKITLAVTILLTFSLFAGDPQAPTDLDRARWTMSDMATWRIALGAYRQDHGSFPVASTIEEARKAVEPIYISQAPTRDAWGNAYRFEGSVEGFRIVSAGADGTFQSESWETAGRESSLAADAVATHEGRWLLRCWNLEQK